jgi:hypothetical protein
VGSQTDSTRGILKLLTYRLPPEALAEIERAERERAGRRGRIETNAATARTSVEARRGFTRR